MPVFSACEAHDKVAFAPSTASYASLCEVGPSIVHHPEILQCSRVVEYKKRDLIIREGMPTDHVCVLLSGTAMSCRTAANGQQTLLCFLGSGNLYGFMTMFGNLVQTMTVEALEPCRNLEIDKVQLKKILLQHSALMWKFTEAIAEGVSTSTQIVENHSLATELRVHKCLLNLCQQFGHKTMDGIELRVNLTQDNLASYAGTTRVTTAKILSRLIKQGALRTKPKPWLILRIESLMETLLNASKVREIMTQ